MAAKVINTVLKLRDEMSGGLIKAAKNTEGVSKEMLKATRQVVAFKNKSVKAVSETARQFADLGKKVTLATVAAGGAVATLAAKTGFSEAMDLEGYRLQLETATKDTQKASEIMRYAVEMANKTPFEGGEMVEAAAKFESMGMSATTWLARAGDMAAATNKSMDQATEALIDAQTGELERLKEFGITKAKILEQGEKMFAGVQIANNNGQIVNQEKFNEAMIALMEDRFAGGMEKQATTMKGLWSTVTGVTKSALANIVGMSNDGSIRAGSALDYLKRRVNGVADRLTQWQKDGTIDRIADRLTNYLGKGLEAAEKASEQAGKAFNWLNENAITPLQNKIAEWQADGTIDKLWESLSGGATTAVNTAGKGFSFIVDNFDTIKTIAATIGGGALGLKIATFVGGVIEAAGAAGGFGATVAAVLANINPVVLGITAAGAAIGFVAANWADFKKTFEIIGGSIKQTADRVFGSVTWWFRQVPIRVKEMKAGAVQNFNALKNKLGEFATGVRNKLQPVFDVINRLREGFASVWNYISQPLDTVAYGSGGVLSAVSAAASTIGGHALGTSYFSGGLTRVNERGGEIMNLPNGTKIIPHDISRRMAGAPQISVSVNIAGNVIGNREYANEMADVVCGKILRAFENYA